MQWDNIFVVVAAVFVCSSFFIILLSFSLASSLFRFHCVSISDSFVTLMEESSMMQILFMTV